MSNSNPNYFRLGLFVFGGIAALVAVILIFGSGQLFKKSFMVETYVEKSVTGLDVGADVRFRGVKLGQVTAILLSGRVYENEIKLDNRKEYVIVRMRILGDPDELLNNVNSLVAVDLRARIKSMGITGVNYVEFDYYPDYKNYPTLPYTWTPKYAVIPSLPSQTEQLLAGLQGLMQKLDQADFGSTQRKFDSLLTNLNSILTGDGKANAGIVQSVQDLNVLLTKINQVTNNEELNILMREIIASAISLRQTLGSVQGDTALSVENIKQASAQLNDFTRIISQSPSSLIWSESPAKIILPTNGTQGASTEGVQK
jgi:phospholipid/cholesterol/gamma-HCH transport system substrate-binding protein/paraquat-inducible protein B